MTLADGRLGRLLGITRQGTSGPLHILQLLVVDRNQLYFLTTTTLASTFGRDEPMLRSSLTSFTLGA